MRKKAFIALLLTLFLVFGYGSVAYSNSQINVDYYYFNACGACNEEEEFRELFFHNSEAILDENSLSLVCHNTYQHSEEEKYKQACTTLKIPEDQRKLPMLVIGSTVLTGESQIKTDMTTALSAEKLKSTDQVNEQSVSSKIVYFYVSPCEDCNEVKEYFGTLQPSYQVVYQGKTIICTLMIESHNVVDAKGLELARKYFDIWGIPEDEQKVPVIFFRDGYLSGVEQIEDGLQNAILEGRCIDTELPDGEIKLEPYEWPGIFLVGLINGFNPCSVSMLLLLMTLLLSRNANILKLGVSFIAGKSFAYLMLGTVLFNLFALIDDSVFIFFQTAGKILLLIISIIVAVLNISDFMSAKNEKYNKIHMQLPTPLRKFNHKWIERMTMNTSGKLLVLIVFVLGIMISVGEFLCTGQIYLATILYIVNRNTAFNLQTIGMLLLYTVGMMIPPLVLTVAVWKGREVFNLMELARLNMPIIKIINAAVFILFGLIIFLSF